MPKVKEIKEILKSLGTEDSEIEKLMSDDDKVTVDTKVITDGITATLKTVMENDGTIDTIKSEVRGEALAARDQRYRTSLKAQGVEITQAEYDALPKADRSDKLTELGVKRLAEKLKAPSSDPEKDKEIERLNAENLKWQTDYKKVLEEDLPAANSAAEKRITEFKKDNAIRSTFSRVNAGKLIASEDILWPGIASKFNEAYDTIEDNGQIFPVKKGTTIKLHKDSKPVSLDSLMEELSADVRKKSEDVVKRRIPEPGDKPATVSAGAKRAQDLREKREAEIEANK